VGIFWDYMIYELCPKIGMEGVYRTRDNGYRSKHVGAFMPIKYFGMILCKDKISRNINPSFHVGVVFQAS
jgi:hypothetical protein